MLTAKQEKFVQGLIEGKSKIDSYKAAYNASKMSDKTIYKKASKLYKEGAVRGRYDELLAEVTKESVDIGTRLDKQDDMIGTADILDFVEITENDFGKAILKLRDDIPDGAGVAIKSMSIDARGSLRIELYDKNPFIERMRKRHGIDDAEPDAVKVKIELPENYVQ